MSDASRVVNRQTPDETIAADLGHQHVHFVGIGGCGMSGLARLVRAHGAHCSGSDQQRNPAVESLIENGFHVEHAQSAASLPHQAELVVISAAIAADHPEVIEARRRGVRVVKYAWLLGKVMAQRTGVAVAGTHGKSTTTSILCHLLIRCGLDPSFIVGANCPQIGGGWRCAQGRPEDKAQTEILVAEACEYDRSFHHLTPSHGIILNVEADHLDMYANLGEIVESFAGFARGIRPASEGGTLLINHEMGARVEVTTGLACAIETLGFSPQADWQVSLEADDQTKSGLGGQVQLHHQGNLVARWTSPLVGEHMAYNAAAAAVTAHRLAAPWSRIVAGLESFQGLDRRMQTVGAMPVGQTTHRTGQGHPPAIPIIDDYGHHPTEIESTLRAIRGHFSPNRLICVFQPHQHSRTRFLLDQFAVSFSHCDLVLVPEIYFVRDSQQERESVTADDLVDRLKDHGVDARHLHPFTTIIEQIRNQARPGDLVVTMGAGDVWKVAQALAQPESETNGSMQ